MKKYEYMIVYSSHNGGIGRNSLTSINKLNSYTFLEEIDQLLHEKWLFRRNGSRATPV